MGSWSRATPWRQGHLLQAETIRELGIHAGFPPENVAAVVITHDCDLAQLPDSEPLVEVMVGVFVEGAPDGNYTNCKNLRRLHVGYSASGGNLYVELNASSRTFIPKENSESPAQGLSEHSPADAHRMTATERGILQRWLASRYRRSAFPDEFDRRLRDETKLADKVAKAFRNTGAHIVAVFFDVDSGTERMREGEDDPYELMVTLLYATDVDPEAAEAAAEAASVTIRDAFNARCLVGGQWKWIELVGVEVMADQALSYAHSLVLAKWQADHISLRTDPQQPMLEY